MKFFPKLKDYLMNKGNWIWTKSGKPEADWGKDFDQIFGGNLWREGDYKHKYTGEGSMWTTCGEDVKEFIAKQLAQQRKKDLEKIKQKILKEFKALPESYEKGFILGIILFKLSSDK